ncbi:MAG: hydroxypyruvate isomerase family protein [Alphaproteobacteria bacterium]
MTRFSANLGFLWSDLSLPDAIRAAKNAGFDAVECHWPYDIGAETVRATLTETGLPMLSINTSRGNHQVGEMGLNALPGREFEARSAIDQALAYAAQIGAENIHALAGVTAADGAWETFAENLGYACVSAEKYGIGVLIEPINTFDVPGYFLSKTDQAIELIQAVNTSNLKLMFDAYHVERMEGAVCPRLEKLMPWIGHIQFAGVPNRERPDQGGLDYKTVFQTIKHLGYAAPLGAEYKCVGETENTLGWMQTLR